jgi:hypothetical protein
VPAIDIKNPDGMHKAHRPEDIQLIAYQSNWNWLNKNYDI